MKLCPASLLLTAACMGAVIPAEAWADSGDEQVQVRCNADKSFAVMPLWLGDRSDTLEPQYVLDGWTRIAVSRVVTCRVGAEQVSATIHIYPPSAHNCAGGGFAYLDAFSVANRQLIREPLAIDAARGECSSNEAFQRFESLTLLSRPSGFDLTICKQRDPNPHDAPPVCKTRTFSNATSKTLLDEHGLKASPP